MKKTIAIVWALSLGQAALFAQINLAGPGDRNYIERLNQLKSEYASLPPAKKQAVYQELEKLSPKFTNQVSIEQLIEIVHLLNQVIKDTSKYAPGEKLNKFHHDLDDEVRRATNEPVQNTPYKNPIQPENANNAARSPAGEMESTKPKLITPLGALTLLVFLAAALFFILRKWKPDLLHKIIGKPKHHKKREKPQELDWYGDQQRKDQAENPVTPALSETERQQNRILELEAELEKARQENLSLSERIVQLEREKPLPPPLASTPAQPRLFFLSTPNKEGHFNEDGKSASFKPFATMYQFTITDRDGKKAEFEFFNDPSTLPDALNYPDAFLLPVCENENPLNLRARSIKTVRKGLAEFDGIYWRVKRPARISFEP